MDRYDPNQWTKDFVVSNKDFCIRQIKKTNNQVIDYLKQGVHEAVVVGIDRILNGLVTMMNAGYDYRSHACFFAWIQANVMLFGNLSDAPEQNRLKTAKAALLDARDFAKSETAKNNISLIIDDINKGYDLSMLTDKYADDFPNFEIETLADLNNKLDNTPAPVPAKKGKPWWLVVVAIIILALIAMVFLTKEKTGPFEGQSQVPGVATENKITEEITEETTEETTEATEDASTGIVGNWLYVEIYEGEPNPDGGMFPATRNEAYYCFYDDGRFSVGDAMYEEASAADPYAEEIDGRYWVCVGGGGQSGSYTINGNQITFVTDDSVQYGPSTTATQEFTLDGDNLIFEHNFGTTVYKRTEREV